MLKALALQSGKKWKFYLLIANNEQNKEELGNLVSIHHGSTATYLIGNTKSLGRKYNANYVLLWTAIKNAKNEGCKWFDIGGLDSTTPHGIAHFKKGLKAAPYFLVGEWRKFFFPSLNFYS
jgi:lipid II:glycine glycyltransferase (peptidoglycan interpeptide bridge formation enzyme)